ncbi:Ccser1 [Phodopus roborovskii]|uniref:Ccser1 protein n=1 Tax=Phodopus roborovskii TaxID=109678 RepID=A0AAV0A313_PHORO|nr:Ccser1 [Phodopus roborovskii]
MGDSGSRRCTLVSRLPIFRKSISRRHDSLPSSPSSSNTAGVHSSSPSSTNSSSGSVGKRRSIFRAPSISFHHKKGSEPKPEPTDQNLSISNGAQPSHSNTQKLSLEEQVKTRGRHSVVFSSSRSKKITRSLTEDFEREKEPSTNKNVFINCLSSGRSEGDDSGFTEEQTRRSLKQSTKKLLPKSFSSHSKFSKSVPQSQSKSLVPQPEFSLAITQYQEREPALGRPSPSCSADVTEHAGSSLQSPLLSTDLTTAQTPSEFLAFTEDSLSEADAFPKSGSMASHCDNCGHNDATSQPTPGLTAGTKTAMEFVGTVPCTMMSPGRYRLDGRYGSELHSFPETSAANQGKVFMQSTGPLVRNVSDPETHLPAGHQREEKPAAEPMPRTSSPRTLGSYDQHKVLAERIKGVHPVSDSRVIPSSGDHHVFNKTSYGYEASAAKVLASSLSPYHEGRYIERRLRSSSEGTAGSGRMVLKPKDGHAEASSLRKHRAGSSSSKMNSLGCREIFVCGDGCCSFRSDVKCVHTGRRHFSNFLSCWAMGTMHEKSEGHAEPATPFPVPRKADFVKERDVLLRCLQSGPVVDVASSISKATEFAAGQLQKCSILSMETIKRPRLLYTFCFFTFLKLYFTFPPHLSFPHLFLPLFSSPTPPPVHSFSWVRASMRSEHSLAQ